MKQLKPTESPSYGLASAERREEIKDETKILQQNINSILKGDQRAEAEKKEKLTPELIESIMNNPELMEYINKQNPQNFVTKPK